MSKPRARASHKRVSKGLAIALLFGGGGTAALLAPPAAYAATTGSVQGTIKDPTGAPLRGVRVSLVGTGQVARTDANGQYSFTGVTPGNYQVRADLVTFQSATQSVAVTQDVTATIDFSLSRSVLQGSRVVGVAPVKRGDTSTSQVITHVEEEQKRSQPYSLYQTPGILLGEPGITVDPSTGIDHIRGGDYNQTGYQIDGIQITDPLSNGFDTNLVTVGLKSANYYAGGADASYGNSNAGFINTVTTNGRDLKGGQTEYTFGPGYGWNYNGTNTQYGNVTPNGKFDYSVSTVQFSNGFPKSVFGLKSVKSFDGTGKVNYYPDANDTVTGYYAQGFEDYVLPYSSGTTNGNVFFNTSTGDASVNSQANPQDHQTQDYELEYLNYKHNFSPKSYLNAKAYQLHQAIAVHEETLAGEYLDVDETLNGYQLDYGNDFIRQYGLRAGIAYLPSGNDENVLIGVTGPYQDKTAAGYGNRIYDDHLDRYDAYLSNHLALADNKVTADLGVRYSQQRYRLQNLPTSALSGALVNTTTAANIGITSSPDYTSHYVDPRFGLNFSPDRLTVFRTSYGVFSQYPDAGRIEQLPSNLLASGFPTTATDPTTQALTDNYGFGRYREFNKLSPSHLNNFDLGVERGFVPTEGLLRGSYDVSLTGFRRYGYDDLLYVRNAYVPGTSGLRGFSNDGTQHASGVEFVLRKQKRKDTDTNGFFSYTNQVSKATSTFLNAYQSYFYAAFANSPSINLTNAQFAAANKQEFPASYSERNTFFFLVNKKYTKLLDSSLSLDAGSGFPFQSGVSSIVGGVATGIDSQHTALAGLIGAANVGAAAFNEVPIVLPNQTQLTPLNVSPGKTGYHYKFTLNNNFNLTDRLGLFLNVDNLFDKQFAEIFATSDEAGNVFYDPPSAQYPQGRVYYGRRDIVTPTSLQVGFRVKF